MYIFGRHISQSDINYIKGLITSTPSISRRELSRRICEEFDWRAYNGHIKDMSCRKLLCELNRQGIIELSSVEEEYSFMHAQRTPVQVDVAEISCTLEELGEISVTPITSRYSKESKIWTSLLDQYHYLQSGPLCGAQIRYIVKSSKYGYIGGLAFSSACFSLKDRDQHIGWSEAARRSNLPYVVGNDRFLIVRTIRVPNLASYVLSRVLLRLPEDWYQRYNIRPVLVETFVDPRYFRGTCYRASNWEEIGATAGRRDGIRKKIFLFYLCTDWRTILCVEPQDRLGDYPRPESPAHWAEEEFGSLRIYDDRIKQRLYTIAQDFYNNPQANIPEACGSKARSIGAYRFFNNSKVTMDVLLQSHTESTIERIKEHRIVLVPQDTTTLNYTTHTETEGLGPTNNEGDQAIGLLLHDTLAFSEEGTPLGILDAQCWARDENQKRKKDKRNELPIEQKESMKWLRSYQKVAEVQKQCPDTKLVSIGDRESDIYELFLEAEKYPHGPGLLVRSEETRKRKVENEYLWDYMQNLEAAGSLKIHIPHSGSRKARDAVIDIHFAEVSLKPPQKLSSYSPVRVWAVFAVEHNEEEKSPIIWMLLTTVAVTGFEDAKKRIEWYSGRWGIEVSHRTLKSGCRIKDRQFGTADSLQACLGVDMVVAWRIYHLTMLGREVPDSPCTVFFKDVEWKALWCYVNKNPVPPEEPPSLEQAIRMVGAIGGHLGRKQDGFPGTQTIWRGLQRLETATEMYEIFTNQPDPHPMQSGP